MNAVALDCLAVKVTMESWVFHIGCFIVPRQICDRNGSRHKALQLYMCERSPRYQSAERAAHDFNYEGGGGQAC